MEFRRVRHEVPGSPRAELRALCAAVPDEGRATEAHACATIAGAPQRVRDAWVVASTATVEELGRSYMAAADATHAWLSPTVTGRKKLLDVDLSVKRAVERAEKCGTCLRVFAQRDRPERVAVPAWCNTRVCLSCLRRRLRATGDRWKPIFALPVRPGTRASLVTIGNPGHVLTRDEVRAYLRRLRSFLRAMRRGAPRYGIPERAWVGGLRTLEVVPKEDGGFKHVHMLVFRRDYVPYGWSEERWRGLLAEVEPARLAAWREVYGDFPMPAKGVVARLRREDRKRQRRDPGCARLVTPEKLGMRGLLRSRGLGENFDDKTLTTSGDGADAARAYMEKVGAYMEKVEGGKAATVGDAAARLDGLAWGGRLDIQRAMRGVRLMDAFGDVRGLLGGPNLLRRSRAGRPCGPLTPLGTVEPAYLDGMEIDDGEGVTVEKATFYRSDTIATWATWADPGPMRARLLHGKPERRKGKGPKRRARRPTTAPGPRGTERQQRLYPQRAPP